MNPSRVRLLLFAVLLVPLALLTAPPAATQQHRGIPDLPEPLRTAAQLPDEILAQLPANAAEAGLAYAPRLVRVEVPTREDRARLVGSGLDVTEHAGDDFIEVVLTEASHEQVIDDLGLSFTVVTEDLIAQERERILADAAYYQQNDESPLPSGRTTYRVLAEFGEEIDQLVADNPDLAKRISVGESVEGRDLTGIEIGVDINAPEDGRPVMLMFGAHHAREWPSAEAPMEFAHDLIDNFNAGDARTVDLLSRTRVIIVPVSNPDGYDISRTQGDLIDLNPLQDQDPAGGTVVILATPGGAYKRKNCRLVDGQTQPPGPCAAAPGQGGFGPGVDLNRNYGALWGGPGAAGQEPNPDEAEVTVADPTYRGPAPFSEPETQAIRTLISTRQVTTVITNHTFGNLLLRPVGVEPSTVGPDGLPVGFAPDECFPTPEGDNGMQALGERMTAQTGYSNQFGWELYDTTGTTEDYSYNATGGYGYTFEIGPEQFHPPFEEWIAEYEGTAEAAQAVTPDTVSGLTSLAGRDCGELVPADRVGGGLREAYYLALENAADAGTHSILRGTAPEGAEIGLSRTGTFPLWDGTPFEDTVTTTMTVGEGSTFEYHVNPSTRPFVASRPYFEGEAPEPDITPVSEEDRSGNNAPLPGTSEDQPVDVPEGVDALVVTVTAAAPNDWDIELISPDGVVLDSSAGENTDERVEFSRPNGIRPGQYVVRITNFAAAEDWNMHILLGTLPDADTNEDLLEFSPGEVEEWTVTCTIDDDVVATREVTVNRGQSRDLGDFCAAGPNVDGVSRLSGPDRFATAIAVSGSRFAEEDSAGAVVLARGDEPDGFADALAGGPLAVARNAPLLITEPQALREDVAGEIDRVLPDGGTVYLLGGPGALAPAVETAVEDAGYAPVRVAGPDRYGTAVAIADELGNPSLVLIATGEAFPDALTGSAAAGAGGGAVLLTSGDSAHPATSAYLDQHQPERVVAVGAPAARAFPDATAAVGEDRVDTALTVAGLLFDQPTVAGLARGDRFPDALSGGAHVGALGGPMLLTPSDALDERVGAYVCATDAIEDVVVYGGTAAVADGVVADVGAAVAGEAC